MSRTFAGRYTVERELGRGATATVYLARDTHRGTAVAIKVLRPELAQSVGADRFLREIKVNEKLQHPHILPVLDSGEHEGQLYFVLPLMEGGSLRQMLMREKQLPIEVAVAFTRTVAEALDYAHSQGLIHRDVKPENILFTSGQACLADFGIARALERAIDESTTATGLVRGTPAYMSPEQASGSRDYDGRSDQYSLACVLYEMLAGVPAFIGPTPEAIIAMRFQHPPRELRVFRPAVPPALEAVIHKALSITAADRYAKAGEFAKALESAARGPIVASRTKRIATMAAGLFAASVVALGAYVGGLNIWSERLPRPDTTKYVILPVEGDSSLPAGEVDELLHKAFSAWSGITVPTRFEVRTAFGSESPVASDAEAKRGIRRLGASRYIRVRATGTPERMLLTAGLFDVDRPSAMSQMSVEKATVGSTAWELDALAAKLLFRGKLPKFTGSRVLPAVQLHERAIEAREAFDLRKSDSLLLAVLELDPKFGHAGLLLAQVRAWNREPVERWQSWAEMAANDTAIGGEEHEFAVALTSMAKGDFGRACRSMESLVSRAPRDFARWYSLATCRAADSVVVRDVRSPSGWRFRSSYAHALRAYTRAFELAPAMHRGFRAGAYSDLRRLLYADNNLMRAGVSMAGENEAFMALASWRRDSIAFIPYPAQSGFPTSANTLRTLRTAVEQQRKLFARIAKYWDAALPNNAGTKEAVAISLDMLGEPSALDTLRLARRLAEEPLQALRLAATEVFLRVALGRRSREHVVAAAKLADSLLAPGWPAGRESARILAPVAALTGRCRQAAHLSARSTMPTTGARIGVPQDAYEAADSLTVFTALGCRMADDTLGLASVERGLRSARRSLREQLQIEDWLLGRALMLAPSLDSARIDRLAQVGNRSVLAAIRLALRGSTSEARKYLNDTRISRGTEGTADISSDVVYTEARLWVILGDTTAAIEWLDQQLNRATWLQLVFEFPTSSGALLRAIVLRADLASARGDAQTAAKWAAIPAELWTSPNAELRGIAERMRRLASSN